MGGELSVENGRKGVCVISSDIIEYIDEKVVDFKIDLISGISNTVLASSKPLQTKINIDGKYLI